MSEEAVHFWLAVGIIAILIIAGINSKNSDPCGDPFDPGYVSCSQYYQDMDDAANMTPEM